MNILDPDVIVLGGGMSNVDRLYQTVGQLIKQFVFGGECETPVRKAKHGDSAAYAALRGYGHKSKNVGNWRIMPDATLAASYQACKMCQNRVGRIRRSRRIRQ